MWLLTRCVPLLLVSVFAGDSECVADGTDGPKEGSDCGCSSAINRAPSKDGAELLRQASVSDALVEGTQLSTNAMTHNTEMVEIPPGMFAMGEVKEKVFFKQDGEGPLRRVRMSGFQMDTYEVSNTKFLDFVTETRYLTDAERIGDSFVAEVYLTEKVSKAIDKAVAAVPWWLPVQNATWQQPEGVDSALDGPASRFGNRWNHPVVHISWNDATAYCRWRNASLPSEAQWEYAARGGESQKLYPWGDEMYGNETPEIPKKHRMNIWQGKFPKLNTAKDGWNKTAPVDAFGPQNDYGLYNMVGNVWEWVTDWFAPVHFLTEENQASGFIDPLGPSEEELDYIAEQGYVKKDVSGVYDKVKKGGSFMCHKSYCWRYRVCARSHLTADSTAHHLGFRCIRSPTDESLAHWSTVAPLDATAKHGGALAEKGSYEPGS